MRTVEGYMLLPRRVGEVRGQSQEAKKGQKPPLKPGLPAVGTLVHGLQGLRQGYSWLRHLPDRKMRLEKQAALPPVHRGFSSRLSAACALAGGSWASGAV